MQLDSSKSTEPDHDAKCSTSTVPQLRHGLLVPFYKLFFATALSSKLLIIAMGIVVHMLLVSRCAAFVHTTTKPALLLIDVSMSLVAYTWFRSSGILDSGQRMTIPSDSER